MTWTACSFFVFACFCVTITVVSSVSLRRPLPALIIPIFVFGMLSPATGAGKGISKQNSRRAPACIARPYCGHLAALAALSAGDPAYQPGFEQADTSVDAVIPLYGVYDFTDHDGQDLNRALREFLGDKVMPGSLAQFSELWSQASPIVRVHDQAPPFFVIHGDTDVMTSWEVARDFSDRLEAVSQQPVVHAELPGCQHGFDGMHSVRSNYLVNHITDFLEWAHANRLRVG